MRFYRYFLEQQNINGCTAVVGFDLSSEFCMSKSSRSNVFCHFSALIYSIVF